MPHRFSLPADAGLPDIFKQYPQIYGPWSILSQELMNGASPLTPAEREIILSYAAGVGGCELVAGACAEVAYAWGVERGSIEDLLQSPRHRGSMHA